MKIFKLLLTAVLVVGFIMPGCDSINCNCGDTKPYFDIEGFDASLIQANVASLQWEEFRGTMNYITTYYGDLNMEQKENEFYTFSLISSALACSCLPNGYDGSEVGIDSLTFTTTYDYNANFPAGSDISDILEFRPWDRDYMTYAEFMVENDLSVIREQEDFRLTEAPDMTDTPLQLTIRLVLDNGEIYELTTEGINLTL